MIPMTCHEIASIVQSLGNLLETVRHAHPADRSDDLNAHVSIMCLASAVLIVEDPGQRQRLLWRLM